MKRRDFFVASVGLFALAKNAKLYGQEVKKSSVDLKYLMERFGKYRGLNENPLGCSPTLKKTLFDESFFDYFNKYDFYSNFYEILKKDISQFYSVDEQSISISAGSKQIIRNIVSYYGAKGYQVIVSVPEYSRIRRYARHFGVKLHEIELGSDRRHDFEKLIAESKKARSVVYLSNPHMPYGGYFNLGEIKNLLEKLNNSLVIIDEAYMEYASLNMSASAINEIKRFENLAVIKTFSKAYGLAGMRVGFVISSNKELHNACMDGRVMELNPIAARAASLALKDQDWIKKSYEFNLSNLSKISEQCKNLNLLTTTGQGNFLSLILDKKKDIQKLKNAGVIINENSQKENSILVSSESYEVVLEFLREIKKYV
jgi:histidinol-phosphate aminotransferase